MGQIAAGYQHTCVVTNGGGAKCWGLNQQGQLGNGTITATAVTGTVDVLGLAGGVTAIDAGGFHTCALTIAGGVKCWGSNEYGQLGDGTNADSSVPVDVSGLGSGVKAITAGESHSCALTTDGGVKCWGHNLDGQLGNGTKHDSSVPVDVSGLGSGVKATSAGTLHTCALTDSDGVACWGYGQSDDLSTFTSTVPVDVPGLPSGAKALSASLDRTCALMPLGAVTCWGPNYPPPQGAELPDRFVSVDLSHLEGEVAAIALGETHACVITGSGDVGCWGDNSHGQLGSVSKSDGPITVPIEVASLTSDVSAIATGGQHTCALLTGGGIECWGSNDAGQLGTVARCGSSSVPVDVLVDIDAVMPSASPRPTQMQLGEIDHPTGPRDVVLRFDRGPDTAVGDLEGELFQPGPEFTLYGDGTLIFRNDGSPSPVAKGPIMRGDPFKITNLEEDQIQSLLRFALERGGLGNACERYESQDTDVATSGVFTIRAGGFDKRVEDFGSGPFGPLRDFLRDVAASSTSPSVWAPDRYWGNLLNAGIFKHIGDGLAPGLAETGAVPWPWPDITPADFIGLEEPNPGRRVMSADEAAVLGLSDDGGVVRRVYLRAPKGKAIYYFSLWPMSPDEIN